MNTKSCFAPAHILLPSEQIPLEKWGCIPVSFTPDFLPFSESFLQKRLYKPFLKTYYISNIFHGANAVQPPVQHSNTIKEGFIYARKEKDRSGCSCCGSSCR